jgi:ribosomal protein L31E
MEKGTITLRLNPYLRGVPGYKRTSKAIKKVRSILQRHTKSKDVRIGPYLNDKIWSQGRKSPPNKIQIEIIKKDDHFFAELPNAPKEKVEELKKKKKEVKEEKKEEKKEVKEEKKEEKKVEDKTQTEVKTEEPVKEEKAEVKKKEDKTQQVTKEASSPK